MQYFVERNNKSINPVIYCKSHHDNDSHGCILTEGENGFMRKFTENSKIPKFEYFTAHL